MCDHTQLRLHGDVGVHRQHYHNCKNLWQGGPRLSWPYLADELAGERERTAPCGVFRKRVWMQPRTTEAPASSPITTLVIDGAKLTEAPRHDVAHLQRAETAAAVALVQAFLVHGLQHATLCIHFITIMEATVALR